MTESAKVCIQSAMQNGVDEAKYWHESDIYNSFRSFCNWNIEIISSKRGCGYWLWKPAIIYDTIRIMHDEDILIYSDAGVKWINNVNEIISRMNQDIFLFSNGHEHVHWCKMDVIKAINGLTKNDFHNASGDYSCLTFQQCQASVIFFKVNQKTRNFAKEWLLWCQMPGFIDDSPSKLPNHPEFAEHRHDQAILTCLAIKYGYKLHWWADKLWYESQRYRWAEDTYPSMFEHHRFRDKGKGGGKDPEWE
jgi:hypothetical protein